MKPYEFIWRVDEQGNPMTVQIQEQTYVGETLYLVLEEIPDNYNRVTIVSSTGKKFYESLNRNVLGNNKFYVDYQNGIIYFDSSMLGQTVYVNYYGKGYKRINSQRIAQEEQVMTLSAEPTITYPSIEELMQRLETLEQEVESLKEQLNSSESE